VNGLLHSFPESDRRVDETLPQDLEGTFRQFLRQPLVGMRPSSGIMCVGAYSSKQGNGSIIEKIQLSQGNFGFRAWESSGSVFWGLDDPSQSMYQEYFGMPRPLKEIIQKDTKLLDTTRNGEFDGVQDDNQLGFLGRKGLDVRRHLMIYRRSMGLRNDYR
jgi:hypothetical protein